VGDGDDRAFVVTQVVFQPGHGLGVQVVGGLVEQQDVGFGQQQAGESDAPFSPPDRILTGVSPGGSAGLHGDFQVRIEVPGVVLVEFVLQFGLLGDQRVEVGIRFGEFGVDLVVAGQQVHDGLDGLAHHFDDGFGLVELRFLLSKPTV
jgi:hypothetical protein